MDHTPALQGEVEVREREAAAEDAREGIVGDRSTQVFPAGAVGRSMLALVADRITDEGPVDLRLREVLQGGVDVRGGVRVTVPPWP